MGEFYVRSSDGSDSDNGTTWALAKATIASAVTACTADGDIVYVADGHSEPTGAKTWSTAYEIRIIAVDDTSDPEPPTAKASSRVLVSGTSEDDYLRLGVNRRTMHIEGLDLKIGRYAEGATYNGLHVIFEDCNLQMFSAGVTRYFDLLADDGGHVLELINTDVNLPSADNYFRLGYGGRLIWRGGTLTGNPTQLVVASQRSGGAEISGVDLSSLTNTIFNSSNVSGYNECKAVGCKLGSAVTLFAGINEANDVGIMRGCHTADGYYAFHEETYAGIASEETAIYRTAGATYDGTNEFSVDMTTDASAAPYKEPLRFKLAEIYIDTADYTTNVNFKVHLARNGSAVAYDDEDFWLEIVHPDGADNALKNLVTTKNAPLTAVTALTTETGLWTGLGGTNKQMSVSKAIAIGASAGNIASGVVEIYACFAAASDAAFVCPDPVIS